MKKNLFTFLALFALVFSVNTANAQCGALGCNDLIQISLSPTDCTAEINYDLVLEGTYDASCEPFTVMLLASPDANAAVIDAGPLPVLNSTHVGQTLGVKVVAASGNSCWGAIAVEDKTAPEIECPCGSTAETVTEFTGELTAASPTFNRPFGLGGACAPSAVGTDVSYQVFEFMVDAAGDYNFEVTSFGGGDSFLAVYEMSFDPTDPCGNMVTNNDDGGTGLLSLAVTPAMVGESYFLVMTSFGNGTLGVFDIDISNDFGGNVFTGEPSGCDDYVCTDLPMLLAGGGPTATATDNCGGNVDITFEDEVVDGGDCATTVITRTFTATDASGNTAMCIAVINVEPVSYLDVVFPDNYDGIENPAFDCSQYPAAASLTGEPTINGIGLYNNSVCGLIATIDSEQEIAPCDGTTKVLRTWRLTDWCTGESVTDLQIIKYDDTTAPTISCPANATVSVGANSCEAFVSLSAPAATDDCSATINVDGPTGGQVLGLGTHTIAYTATDGCGNEADCSYEITVIDEALPIAVCDLNTVVSLYLDGTEVNAATFDDGSYDHCGNVTLEVRRMDAPHCAGFDGTPYGPTIPVYCCDVNNTTQVELQVTDESGNTNSCMVNVEVQDKLAPTITCPADKTLDCGDDYADMSVTGDATGSDNCSYDITNFITGNLDNCGEGSFTRIFTATDAQGLTASCLQTITVVNSTPFTGNNIFFPLDYNSTTCGTGLNPEDLFFPYNEPTITEDQCDLVAVDYEDAEYPIAAPGCLKIVRTWTVIDWCQFDTDDSDLLPGTQGGEDGIIPGYWVANQELKIINSDAPSIDSGLGSLEFGSLLSVCDLGSAAFSIEVSDDCNDAADLNVSYELDAFSDGGVDATGNGTSFSGDFPYGTHTVTWTVEDGCGNVSEGETVFTIFDAKKPTPVALNGLAIEIMNTGMVPVSAAQLNAGSYDNCGIAEYRLVHPSQGAGQTAPPAGSTDQVIIDCADIATDFFQLVDFWVLDVNGNWDYVQTYVIVEDNMGICGAAGPTASISGNVETEAGDDVADVDVELGGAGVPDFLTGNDGIYDFGSMNTGGAYTVDPTKNMNPLNGVSTFDLVLLSQHILGANTLNSPYKIIAADVNNSGSVTTFDLVELRKLILFIDTDFQNNESWRFVDMNYVFPNPANPFQAAFPELVNIANLTQDEVANFIGVKIGDLNGSATPNQLVGASSRNFDGELTFAIEDATIEAGQTHTVEFKANDFNNMLGYQFTLNMDAAIEVVNVEGNVTNLNEGNFGLAMLNEGVITTSWNEAAGLSLDNDEVIFTLTFVANETVVLSEALSVSSNYTVAEAYTKDGSLMNVSLSFNSGSVATSAAFDLYQNSPNPFRNETIIGFNLPVAQSATVTVYDVSGRVLKLVEGDFAQGYNEVSLNAAELSATGVLYYTLETATDSATKKMILIKK